MFKINNIHGKFTFKNKSALAEMHFVISYWVKHFVALINSYLIVKFMAWKIFEHTRYLLAAVEARSAL